MTLHKKWFTALLSSLGKTKCALGSLAKCVEGTLFIEPTIALRIMTFTELISETLLANVQWYLSKVCASEGPTLFLSFSGVKLTMWMLQKNRR